MNRPSSGRSWLTRSLRILGAGLGLTLAGAVFVAVLAALALLSATVGGPALVELGELLAGR